ncbi:hypothetical protein ACOMHN_010322 [Nucella lapillus]
MTTTESAAWTSVTTAESLSSLTIASSQTQWTAKHGPGSGITGHATPPNPSSSGSVGNPDSVGMSDIGTALDCGVIPALCVLGVVGNSLCVVVFVKQRYRTVAKPLLLAFCASHLLFLLASLLVSVPCIVRKIDREEGRVLRVYMTPQVDVLRDVMSRITVILTLAIGVERCVALTRPLKLRGMCSIPRTRTAVLVTYLCVLALKAPAFFRYDVKHHVIDNVTTVKLHRTRFYVENSAALEFYLDYFLLVLLQGLPLVSITACFVIVLVSLKRRLQCAYPKTITQVGAFDRARGRGQERYAEKEHADLVLEERKLTRALLAILCLCMASELPYLVTQAIHVINPDLQSSSFLVARDVSRLLGVLNSAINFVVFMGLYKHFYVTCKTIIGLCN